jgi:autotransporter translocation and assembly factor TamB
VKDGTGGGRTGGDGRGGGLAPVLAALGGSLGRILLGVVGLLLLTAAGGIVALSQTTLGRQVVADAIEGLLAGVVENGEVRLGPILGGDLLTGALLDRFEITDPDGRLFVGVDSVRIRYNPLSFLVGTYRFDAVTAEHVRIVLRQGEDGRWNFERIFEGEEPGPDDGDGPGTTRLLLSDVTVRSGSMEVRTPWAGDLAGAARDSAIREGLAGDRLWRIRAVGPDRFEREIVLENLRGRFPLIRLVDPVRPMRIDFDDVAARALVVSQPLEVEGLEGSAVFRDSVQIRLVAATVGSSVLSGAGWVVPADPIQFSFALEADPLGFADLQWLPVPVPREGGGPADLSLFTRGATIVVDVADADVRVDDSRARGGFRLALADPPRFEALRLELDPVRLALVDDVLDRPTLIDGFIRGSLRGSGPIDLLDIEARLELADLPGPGADAPSGLDVDGGIAVIEPRRMRELALDMRSFEPKWVRVIGLDAVVGGRTNGRTVLDGVAGGRFSFRTDLAHVLPGRDASRVRGGGTVDLRERREIDVDIFLEPLDVALVESALPEGLEVVGEVRGEVTARGPLEDLRVVADLRTPRGLLNFDGRFDLTAERKAYDALLTARDIQLAEWLEHGPRTRLAIDGRVAGSGTDPATLDARFDLRILPSLVEGAAVDTSVIRFTLAEGLARVDTFAIRSRAGSVEGRGAFGLTAERSGSLVLDIDVPDLSEWNAWLVEGRNPARVEEDVTDLFEAFGRAETPEEAAEAAPDTLAGRLQAIGVMYGNVDRFSVGGRAYASDLSWGEFGTDSVRITLEIPDPRQPDSLIVHAAAMDARLWGRDLDTLDVLWERTSAESHDVELFARSDTSVELSTHLSALWTEREKAFRVTRFEMKEGERTLVLRDTAFVTWGESGLTARGVRLLGGDGGLLVLSGAIPDSGDAALDLRVVDLRVENLLAGVGNPLSLRGRLDLELRVRGTADAPLAELDLSVDEPSVRGVGYERLIADLSYAGRRLAVNTALVSGETEIARVDGFLRADLSLRDVERRLLDDPIDLTVAVDSMPLRAIELRVESLRDVDGYALGRFRVTGSPGELRYDGETRILAASATVPALGVRFRDVIGRFVFAGETARIDTLSIRSSAGGTAVVRGRIGLQDPTDVSFDLDLHARRFRGIDRRNVSAEIDGDGELNGKYASPELTGRFQVSRGELDLDRFTRQATAVDLTDPAIYSLLDTTLVVDRRILGRLDNPFMQNLRVDVDLQVGPDFWLRSRALEVEVAGELDVQMDRAARDLVAYGSLSLPRGKFRYQSGAGTDLTSLYSRQLQIERGEIAFSGTPGLDPNLDIDAAYRARGDLGQVTIQVHVGGTLLAPTMTTSSEPPLPESDRICYLLFSTACFGAGSQGGEFAASLVRESLLGTVSSQISQVLVGGVGIVDYVDIRSSGTPQGQLEAGQTSLLYGTEVEIGRYLTPDLFLKATQPLGGQLPGMSLDWSFLPKWRLELKTEDRFKRYSVYGYNYSFSGFSKRTWGLMLFREWNF